MIKEICMFFTYCTYAKLTEFKVLKLIVCPIAIDTTLKHNIVLRSTICYFSTMK